jgi:cytochrome c biogenesis protein CcmG, thiol:disulfide interchange protein DsbE
VVKAWRVSLALVALALVASSCAEGAPDGNDRPPPVLPSPRAINATTAPLLPVSRFELPGVDFDEFQRLLRQLRGTPVVVNIWGSWCGPCRQEAPRLAEAARAFGRRVQFLGVDVEDNRLDARIFIRDAGWPYPSVFDPPRAVLTGLGYLGPPITLVFDRRGHRIKVFTGPLDRAGDLERVLPQVV